MGGNVSHDLHIKPLDRGPTREKEARGTPERVERTELMKATGAD